MPPQKGIPRISVSGALRHSRKDAASGWKPFQLEVFGASTCLFEVPAWLIHFPSLSLPFEEERDAPWSSHFGRNAAGTELLDMQMLWQHLSTCGCNKLLLAFDSKNLGSSCGGTLGVPNGTSLLWSCCVLLDSAEGEADWDLICLEPKCFDEPFP